MEKVFFGTNGDNPTREMGLGGIRAAALYGLVKRENSSTYEGNLCNQIKTKPEKCKREKERQTEIYIYVYIQRQREKQTDRDSIDGDRDTD